MDRFSLLLRAAQQQQQKKQHPIAKKVLLVRFDPTLDRTMFKEFLRHARDADIPVYLMNKDYRWAYAQKFYQLNPEERIKLIKGFFTYEDMNDIFKKICEIEKIHARDIHYVAIGQDRRFRQQNKHLVGSPEQFFQTVQSVIAP